MIGCQLLLSTACLVFSDDCVTRDTGKVLCGEIVDETESVIKIKSQGVTWTLSKTEIKLVQREAEIVKKQRADYNGLLTYVLNPNQEFGVETYDQSIAAFEKYLADYPGSPYAADVKQRLAEWQQEKNKVVAGKVKFAGQWMNPEEKKARVEKHENKQQLSQSTTRVTELKNTLASLERLHEQILGRISADQETLRIKQLEFDAEPASVNRPLLSQDLNRAPISSRGPRGQIFQKPIQQATSLIPNPKKAQLKQLIDTVQARLTGEQAEAGRLETRIANVRAEAQQAEQAIVTSVHEAAKPQAGGSSFFDRYWVWGAAALGLIILLRVVAAKFR